jgi:hypothetical protein
MTGKKNRRSIIWAILGAGVISMVAAVILLIDTTAMVQVENWSDAPMEIVTLSYSDLVLAQNEVLESREVRNFSFDPLGKRADITLIIKVDGSQQEQTYEFFVLRSRIWECYYTISISEKNLEFVGCPVL